MDDVLRGLRSSSSEHREEALVQLAVVVEDPRTERLVVPGDPRLVGIVDIASREHLVAIPRRIEEVHRLSARDPVAGRTDVDRGSRAREDVGCPQYLFPGSESE